MIRNTYEAMVQMNPKMENYHFFTGDEVEYTFEFSEVVKDFTIEKYISRGEYCGESGRPGLGGNHVYSIAKAHKGFINLTSDEEWNVIVEILLPVTYYNECSTDKFTAYEHTKECL